MQLAKELSLKEEQVRKTVELIDEGCTIPFIARYRKEVTGSLDDTVLRALEERLTYLRNLQKRKDEVAKAITDLGLMTDEIFAALEEAQILTEVEDIYRPFKPKRKTRASVAREKGLAPLAQLLLEQDPGTDPEKEAAAYIHEEKGVLSVEEALQGAQDILAEDISDNAEYRKEIRHLTSRFGSLLCKQAKEEDSVYANYYDFSSPLKDLPGHRILAINRGEKEEFLKVSVEISKDLPLNYLFSQVVKDHRTPSAKIVIRALIDGYDRLIAPSVEREIRTELFEKAAEGAIALFSENLKNLLMSAPLKGKTVLGLDPGYRTGCKVAIVDETGKVLDTAKGIAYYTGLPMVIVPTVCATDAPCSSLSVMYTDEGVFDAYLFLDNCPNVVIVDSEIIARAPARLLVAGMGDAMATYFEARACRASGSNNQVAAKPTRTATEMAALTWKYLQTDGAKAKMAVEAGVVTPALENIIEVNTYLSGVGFESGGLAAAHGIQKGFTVIPELHEAYHGEKVAFCTLTQLILENAPTEEIRSVLDFCLSVGLPVCFADLGYEAVDAEAVRQAAEKACVPGSTIHNLPFEVTAGMVADALLAADAMGRVYRAEK